VVAALRLLVVIDEFYSVWRALFIAIHNGCVTSICDIQSLTTTPLSCRNRPRGHHSINFCYSRSIIQAASLHPATVGPRAASGVGPLRDRKPPSNRELETRFFGRSQSN
jgi:hypothetical protein